MTQSLDSPKVKILEKFSSDEVVKRNLKYVDDRRKGLIKSLETKFPRLNKKLMGGIELDTITCVAALSGAGKSTISKCLRDSIYELNKEVDSKQYVFNFEMLAHQQIGHNQILLNRHCCLLLFLFRPLLLLPRCEVQLSPCYPQN